MMLVKHRAATHSKIEYPLLVVFSICLTALLSSAICCKGGKDCSCKGDSVHHSRQSAANQSAGNDATRMPPEVVPKQLGRPRSAGTEGFSAKFIIGPAMVRQIILDSDNGTFLTEEAEVPHCNTERIKWRTWRDWRECVDNGIDTHYNWKKGAKYILRWRSLETLEVLGEYIRNGKPFRRLLAFRHGYALEAGAKISSIVAHSMFGNTRTDVSRSGFVNGEKVAAASIFPDGRVLIVSVRGRKTPIANLRWWKLGETVVGNTFGSFKYQKKMFLAPDWKRLGMAWRINYAMCGTESQRSCDEAKNNFGEGSPYKNVLERDRSIVLATSHDGRKVALYIFGSLLMYSHVQERLSLIDRFKDIFYVDKDNYVKNPLLVWDSKGEKLALSSSYRINYIINTNDMQRIALLDKSNPRDFGYFYILTEAQRGAVFSNTDNAIFVYGDLQGKIVYYNVHKSSAKTISIPYIDDLGASVQNATDLYYPGPIAYINVHGKRIIAWRDGVVYVLDSVTSQLRGRIGTDSLTGYSRSISTLLFPRESP